MWLGRQLRSLGISKERAKLLSIKVVKARGIKFIIRRLNPIDYANLKFEPFMSVRGSDQFVSDKEREAQVAKDLQNPEKLGQVLEGVKKQYRPVLTKGIIWPKVTEKEIDGAVFVDDFFNEADLETATKLYGAIMELSSKKKSLFTFTRLKLSDMISLRSGMVNSPAK